MVKIAKSLLQKQILNPIGTCVLIFDQNSKSKKKKEKEVKLQREKRKPLGSLDFGISLHKKTFSCSSMLQL